MYSGNVVKQLIRRACTCIRCGQLMSPSCKCWQQVLLHCPKCKRSHMALPEASDPPNTYMVSIACNLCDDSRYKIRYYDRSKREIRA